MSRFVVHAAVSSLLFTAIGVHATDLNLPGAAATCAKLLTLDVRPNRPLPPLLRELAEDLGRRQATTERDPSAGMREAIERLAAAQGLSPEQMKRLLNDKAIGRYQSIVQAYVVAELEARGFDREAVVDFLMNFDLTYPIDQQVEFAHAVTVRMMVTINDSPSATSDRTLRHFIELADEFHVKREVFGEFYGLWRQIRSADVPLVLFVLENVRRVSGAFNARVRDAEDAEAAAREKPVSGWSKLVALVQPTAAAPPPPDARVIARGLFDHFEVPLFIREIDALEPGRPAAPSQLERWAGFAAFSRVHAFLDRLELSPAHALDLLVSREIPYFSASDLDRLAESSELERAGEVPRDLLARERARFTRMTEVAMAYATARRLEDRRLAALRQSREPNLVVVGLFQREFQDYVNRIPFPVAGDITKGIVEVHERTKRGREIGGATFLGIAEAVFDHIVVSRNGFWAVAALEGLNTLSKGYTLDPDKTKRLLERISNHRFREDIFTTEEFPLARFSRGIPWLEPSRWGQDPTIDRDPSPDTARELASRLAEFRALIPEPESKRLPDAVLTQKMIDAATTTQPASFLQVNW